MNADAQARYAARAAADKAAGADAARRGALGRLALKTVVKESHNQPVLAIEYSPDEGTANLFATVGGDQATVYDADHLCGYVAIVAQFNSEATPHSPGGDLTCAAWLAPPPRALRPDSDAVLAVGGAAGVVTVLSVVDGAAVALAKGHAAPLADLSGAAARPGFLASLDRNAVLATWRVDAVERGAVCAGVFETGDATCLATHPSGAWIATGHRSGDVKLWPAPGEDAVAANGDASALEALPRGADAAAAGATTLTPPPPARRALDAPVTSLKWITPGRLAALGGDGRGAVWEVEVGKDAPALSAPVTFRAPGSGGLGSAAGRCRLGATRDGAFIVVGGPAGDAAVIDSTTGARIAAIPTPPRVKAGARAAGIAADGSSVLVAAGAGFMFRYEAKEVEGVAGA